MTGSTRMPRTNDSTRKIVQFPIAPICPRCRGPVGEGTRMTDVLGKVMHEECCLMELKELDFLSRFSDGSH